MQIAIAYHSGSGHTAVIAEAVARGAGEHGATVSLLPVDQLTDAGWDTLREADAIIFGTPTYMAGPSAAFKHFADDSEKVWREQGWRDKLAAGFTVSAGMSGDKIATLGYLSLFAAQHGMQWVSLGLLPGWNRNSGSPDDLNRLGGFLGVLAQANLDEGPDTAPPASDRETAAHLGRRVAQALQRPTTSLSNAVAQALPSFAGTRFSPEEWNVLNQEQIDQFRAHQGTIVEGLFSGLPMLLLTTTGARSGQARTTPLSYTRDGDRHVVLASKLGAPEHPGWYHNLVANPVVTVEVGPERFQAEASVAEGNKRSRLFDAHAAAMPNYAEYQRVTTRIIPVVILDRISA